MMYLLATSRKLSLGTAINDSSLSPKSECSTRGVHSHITTTYYDDLLSCMDRGHIIVPVCLHQIVSGKELIG